MERTIVSHVSALVYERKDFKFFSLVNVPEQEIHFLGIFGLWRQLPSVKQVRRQLNL